MDNTLIVILIIVALVVVGLFVLNMRKQHTDKLRDQFGEEYDRTVDRSDSRHAAEQSLEERQQRVEKYDIRPLTMAQRDRYVGTWDDVQKEFVDHPDNAMNRAHTLIDDVMRDKGYPIDDFEHQYEDLSVNHPVVVKEYRAGHDIVSRHQDGDATTEEMRRGMIHYRTLFDELMRDADDGSANRDGPMGDRDRDGTPNALDARDEASDRNRGPLGDRDGDGMPNAADTRDDRPVAPPPSSPPRR
ncbi:hypothetical protein WJT74_03435 [Sphingomicrobium sp. XHP0239]|uniref:hypothetical protein n=1 Tax=Sphingomicrobium maritimum TaxID=3133972 RepID=UPI0031CC7320